MPLRWRKELRSKSRTRLKMSASTSMKWNARSIFRGNGSRFKNSKCSESKPRNSWTSNVENWASHSFVILSRMSTEPLQCSRITSETTKATKQCCPWTTFRTTTVSSTVKNSMDPRFQMTMTPYNNKTQATSKDQDCKTTKKTERSVMSIQPRSQRMTMQKIRKTRVNNRRM